MGLGNLGLSLAGVLGSGVEGRVRHGDSASVVFRSNSVIGRYF
jgi:hypothetical protein